MKGKKSLFVVNLILIASLVLSPMAVFAQTEEPNAPPAETVIAESAPAEQTGGETAAEAPSVVEAVDNAAAPAPVEEHVVVEAAVVTEETVNKVKEETPQTVTVDEPVTAAEPVTESESAPAAESEVPEQKSEDEGSIGTPLDGELPASNEISLQTDETAAQENNEEPAPEPEPDPLEVDVELDLSKGGVTINDAGTSENEKITVKGTDASGTAVETKVANNSIIRVKQTKATETETTKNIITITLEKIKSFVTVILDSLNINVNKSTPITVNTAADSTVALELDGENKLETTGSNKEDISAIKKTGKGTLVIQNETDDESSLTATATKTYGAAIGGGRSGDAGSIVISGATVTATKTGSSNTSGGAAIGAGAYSNVDEIRIENGAEVTATLGSRGLGGNTSGAAIGAGTGAVAGVTGNVGSITISNSTVTATGHGQGAAIGGGMYGTVGSITIKNSSEVTAEATFTNAAIGGGTGKAKEESSLGGVGSIDISNSTVTANQTNNVQDAGAIGAGLNSTVGSITINNADVTATGKKAAIKGELKEENVTGVEITEGEIVEGQVTGKTFKTTADSRPFPTADPTPEPTPEPKPVVVPEQPKEEDKEEVVIPVIPVLPTPAAPVEEKTVELVESKKDEDTHQSNIVIEGTTAKITVTDEKGETVDAHEVTIKSVAAFEETGATEAAIQLTQKLIVNVDVETMKEVTAQSETNDDAVTVTNEDSVITVKSGETALVSVDVKEVIAAVEETVTVKFNRNTVRVICGAAAYHIDLTDLGDVGTLTLRLENGVLKIYDKNGNLLREVTRA